MRSDASEQCPAAPQGWDWGMAPRGTCLPGAPSCPGVAFWFGLSELKEKPLANVFDWLAGDKRLSTAYILEYLFFFIDVGWILFVEAKVRGKDHPLEGIEGRPRAPGSLGIVQSFSADGL